MNENIKLTTDLIQANLWAFQILIVLVTTFIVSRVRHFTLLRVEKRLAQTNLIWSRSTVEAIRKPAAVLIWVAGVSFAIEIARIEFHTAIFEAVPALRSTAAIAAITWFGFKFVEIYERSYVVKQTESDSTFDRTTVFITSKILRVVVIILGILVAMQTLGLSIAGILAFGGVGGIAIGFAARELIANYFGGLMLFMDRPFKVGETITSSDRDIEGTVQEIGWRQTIIVKFDTRTLYVPNSVFATIVVRNMTRQKNRRIFEYVGIRYDDADQLVAIVSDTKDMLSNHPEIDQESSIMVNFDRFAASSLDIMIYCFTKTIVWAEYHEIKQDILVKTMEIIASHGAEIAFPTSTVYLMNEPDVEKIAEGIVQADQPN